MELSHTEKMALLFAVGIIGGYGALMIFGRRGRATALPEPGQVVGSTPQNPIVTTPTGVVSAGPGPCRAVSMWDFHLRPREQEGREGSTRFPARTEVIILQRGTMTRRGASIYRVRVAHGSDEGWIFLYPYEISGQCAGSPEIVATATTPPAASANPATRVVGSGVT